MDLPSIVFLLIVPFYILFLWIPQLIYNYFTIYIPDFFRQNNTPENHAKKVKRVQAQVMAWNKKGRKTKMCTARPYWKTMAMRHIDKSKFTQIDLDMEDIIEIDMEKKVIRVEPGIQMGTLTHKLVPQGWTIPVVPELETLTLGGLINSAGLEATSHKYGLFATTCIEYEIVLADGQVVTCSEKENADLFYAIPMAYGTLGFMTSVTIPLIQVGKYVKVEYHASHSIAQTEALLRRNNNRFIEGISFGLNDAVVMLGNFVDTAEPGKVNHVNRWYKHWFYLHVKSFLKTTKVTTEYIPTRDYYHRHTRSYYWATESFPILTSRFMSFFMGWLFPINFQFVKFFFPQSRRIMNAGMSVCILQDFMFPLETLEESLTLAHNVTSVYPIWLCPFKLVNRPGLIRLPVGHDGSYVNVGIYGVPPSQKRKKLGSCIEGVKIFEKFAVERYGWQGTFTDCYLSRDDFYKMFDGTLYDKMRMKLDCLDAFPDVYEKTSVYFKKN